MAKCITGNWKNAKYSPRLDLVAILKGKLISQRKPANELQRWIRNTFDAFAPIKLPHFDLTTFSDTSLEGWGCTADQVTEIRGNGIVWKINSLELQPAFFCLKAFCKNKTRLHVLSKLDNTTAVAYINKKRRDHFSLL